MPIPQETEYDQTWHKIIKMEMARMQAKFRLFLAV